MLRLSARLLRLRRRHLLRGFSRLLCLVHRLEKPRAVLYIMYVMYKTVLAGCGGAEWGTGRDWVSCPIPKLNLSWRGTWRTFARWIPMRHSRRSIGNRERGLRRGARY